MRNEPGFKYISAIRGPKTITFGMPYDGYHRVDMSAAPLPTDYRRPGMGYASFGAPVNQAHPLPKSSIEATESVSLNKGFVASAGLSAIKSMAPIFDAALMPPASKIQGTYSTDTIASTLDIAVTLFQVDDLDEVARIYESNGYAVSRYTQQNPLTTLHNRQMYDYLQCDEVNAAGIMDGELMEDFINRIRNGLRLWHTDGNGVLVASKQPFGVRLGVLCARDNTEV